MIMPDPIVYHDATTGLTLFAIVSDSSGSVATIALTESPALSGRYIATDATLVAEPVLPGIYDIRIVDGSSVLYGSGNLNWNGATSVSIFSVGVPVTVTGSPTASSFTVSGLTLDASEHGDQFLSFISGDLVGVWRVISNTSSGSTITLTRAFSKAPTAGDKAVITGSVE